MVKQQIDTLHGAQYVHVHERGGDHYLLLAWFGGYGINVYSVWDNTIDEVNLFHMGFEHEPTLDDAKEACERHIERMESEGDDE